MVRNAYLPQRSIQMGLGEAGIKVPRVRDRASRIRFTSAILPPYLRRTKTIEELLPWLYLKGISTGDFSEALASLLGRGAPGLAAVTIRASILSMVSKLAKSAEHRWLLLRGSELIVRVIAGVQFKNGSLQNPQIIKESPPD